MHAPLRKLVFKVITHPRFPESLKGSISAHTRAWLLALDMSPGIPVSVLVTNGSQLANLHSSMLLPETPVRRWGHELPNMPPPHHLPPFLLL